MIASLPVPYIFLLISITTCFVGRFQEKSVPLLFLGLGIFTALFQGIITYVGFGSIVLYYGLTYRYFRCGCSVIERYILLTLMLICSVLTWKHMVPGFFNTLVYNNVHISSASLPYSMYLNFNKVVLALILLLNSHLLDAQPFIWEKKIPRIITLLTCISLTLLTCLGLTSSYISLDLKLPEILPLWSINNLFFVSFSSSVFFIGFLQTHCQPKCFASYPLLWTTIIACVFGLDHLYAGVTLAIFAMIAGALYGIAYVRTSCLLSSIFIHFFVNLVHILCFTYPASKNLLTLLKS